VTVIDANGGASGDGAQRAGRDGDTTASLDPTLLGQEAAAASLQPGEVPTLVVTRGPDAGTRHPLTEPETRIGRHPDAHVFLDDVTVSRRHALVTLVDGHVVLTDQASLNGTYVEGERVDSRVLAHGDELQVGRFRFVLLLPGAGGAATG
jgi:pSer/pThr/pTyr-binding forkhead associated (FHA) protein